MPSLYYKIDSNVGLNYANIILVISSSFLKLTEIELQGLSII